MEIFLLLVLAAAVLIAVVKLLDWALDQDRKYRKRGKQLIEEIEAWRLEREEHQ